MLILLYIICRVVYNGVRMLYWRSTIVYRNMLTFLLIPTRSHQPAPGKNRCKVVQYECVATLLELAMWKPWHSKKRDTPEQKFTSESQGYHSLSPLWLRLCYCISSRMGGVSTTLEYRSRTLGPEYLYGLYSRGTYAWPFLKDDAPLKHLRNPAAGWLSGHFRDSNGCPWNDLKPTHYTVI